MKTALSVSTAVVAALIATCPAHPVGSAPHDLPPPPPPGDRLLTQAEVDYWFDKSIRPVRKGNDVTELVDGPAANKAMSDAMKTVRGPVRVVHDFGSATGDGIYPRQIGKIAIAADGTMYTSCAQGGANNRGAVMKMTPDGKVSVIHSFDIAHGATPLGGVSLGPDGNLYGTTYEGGKYGTGVIFRVTPAGQLTVLWDFRNGKVVPPPPYPQQPTAQQLLDAAGSYPFSPPVPGKDGNLYGITGYANNQQWGVIYRLSPGGAYKGLFQFKPDNYQIYGNLGVSLSPGIDGNLYGTTSKGGSGGGTVLQIDKNGGVRSLHKFVPATGQVSSNIMQASDGKLYGTAQGGGAGNAGVVYRMTTGGEYDVIHDFKVADGMTPVGGLCEAKDGWLYGTTKYGGVYGRGVVYKIRPSDKAFAVVHSMAGSMIEGRYCVTTPVQHPNGKIYCTASEGGAKGGGTLFSVDTANPDFIYALNWFMNDDFPLYGPNTPQIRTLFKDASDRGAQVRAMLWDQLGTQNTKAIENTNGLYNGAAILDNRTLKAGSHHQKILVVSGPDGLTGFCGGIDFNPDRVVAIKPGDALHDVHCRIKGPAAGDLLTIFGDRWNDHPDRKPLDDVKGPPPGIPVTLPAADPNGTCSVQVGRTYGNSGRYGLNGGGSPYKFAGSGEQSAAKMILNAISKAKSFIYVEDQYFVDTTDPSRPGPLNVRAALVRKLQEPNFKHLTVLIPHGSIVKEPPQLNYRRQQLILALRRAGGSKVRVFFRDPPKSYHSYIHSKVWIFDDRFAIIGSVNTNRRSWTHDSEVAVGICDQGKADGSVYLLPHRLRMRLWAEHLNLGKYVDGVLTGYEAELLDGVASADKWLNRPIGAKLAPYDENSDVEAVHFDTPWNELYDPDGS